MKPHAIALLLLLALAATPPAHAQAPLVFTQLGTDAADDDREAAGSIEDPSGLVGSTIVPAPGNDQANIDDVLGLSVASSAGAADVVFRVDVAEKPEDAARLLGTFCWMAAFQVGSAADEYLALGCTEYDAQGTGTDILDAQSTRGENVLSGMEWASDGAAMLLTVSRSTIGAGPGTVLTDVYALTYMGTSLFVDDPAPDAKSDRDAGESFGSYDLDSGGVSSGTGSTIRHEYHEVTGSTFSVDLAFVPDEWVMHHYNWTSPHDEVQMHCQVSDEDLVWTWSTQKKGTGDNDPSISSLGSHQNGCKEDSSPNGRNVGYKGPLDITISLRAGNGTFSAQIEQAPPRQGGTSSSAGPTPPGGTPPGGSTTTSGQTGGSTAKSPVLPFGILISTLGAAAVLANRRRL